MGRVELASRIVWILFIALWVAAYIFGWACWGDTVVALLLAIGVGMYLR